MSKACSTHGEDEKFMQNFGVKLNGKDHAGGLDRNERILLR
jgi:hypothetical protein